MTDKKNTDMEGEIFQIKALIGDLMNYSQSIQENIWKNLQTQKSTDESIQNNISASYSMTRTENNLMNERISVNASNISAEQYNPNDIKVHLEGEYVLRNDQLWRCKVRNSTEPSEGAEWEKASVVDALIELSQRISALENK